MRALLLACLAALLGAAPARADSHGAVRVIDADTLEVGGVRVRLHGVDAPEAAQLCRDPLGRDWPCGAWATAQARALWDGREASCVLVERDRYGREVSRCAVEGRDLGAALVASGAALAYVAYSPDYLPEERAAEAGARGLWQGSFDLPWDWRRERRGASAASAASGACPVKGNLSDRGRIYHLPGSPAYAATRIDEAAGERWFCSAAEAEAAGWRAPERP
jgi:endonuclease YncB( thermonuclease family)